MIHDGKTGRWHADRSMGQTGLIHCWPTTTMTDIAIQLLATFESLPAHEQHELLIAMLRRTGELVDLQVMARYY